MLPGGRFLSLLALPLVAITLFRQLPGEPVSAAGEQPAPAANAAGSPAPFQLEKGDHICIIGNALAERMQHDGWLETYLHARFPDHDLTVRNLGFSGDEVGGYTDKPDFHKRLRSADFGTADQWLSASAPIPNPGAIADKSAVNPNRFEKVGTNADVIFAFFGYNESYGGETGLPKFKQDLEAFIKHTRSQKYNGRSAPRLVLFSPIAFEDHETPNLPDGKEQNKNLGLYTKAMAEVAKANDVRFVDLFHYTANLYKNARRKPIPITLNGVHLTADVGNRAVAEYIAADLFGPEKPSQDPAAFRKTAVLRAAVIDKNRLFYQRYRATDGYSTFGGRAWLKFVNGQTNYEVVQRELQVIDQMVLNRDKVIWQIARSGGRQPPEQPIKPDDSNLPPFIPVVTNKPGKGPNGTHLFLSGEEAIQSMKIGTGMKVTLFADESMFPELANPVQMAFDPAGRLWVAVWPTYPHWKPGESMNDKLLVFEDTNGDGKADKMTVFADGLHNSTGFEFFNGGVIVAQAPDLVFLKDTNGDGKADLRERILHGLDTADTHHTANSFVLDPGGALYFQEGTFHHSQVEDAYGPPKRNANGGVYRYEPRTQKFDVYVTYGFANPHGHVFDKWGQDIVIDGTGANPYHAPLFSGHLDYPRKHGRPPQVYQQRTRPSGGMEILSSRHFPDEFEGNLLVTNCIGFQGILRYKIGDVGSSLGGQELEPILSSTDPNFRPVDVKTGPDGAIYFVDWQNPIIGHMQHNLRDPSRDRTHGRVYRVTYEGRALSQSPKIAGEPVEKLLELLKHPEDRVRYRARIELGGRPTKEVLASVDKVFGQLVKNNQAELSAHPELEHYLLELLWVCQYHNASSERISKMLGVFCLGSQDFRVRAAAVRVICYSRHHNAYALDILKQFAADKHPRVRLMAVWAASFFTVPEAAEVVFIAQDKPTDLYIDHMIGETMKALEPIVKKAVAEKRPIKFTTPAGARYFLKAVSTDDLLKMDRTREINSELLFRPGVRDEFRRDALAGLAKADGKKEVILLLDAIRQVDAKGGTEESVAFDLIRLLTNRPQLELTTEREELQKLATAGKSPVTRQLGYVALIAADGTTEGAWKLAAQSVSGLEDLVAAMPLVRDPGQRAALYPKVEALLTGLPPELAKTVGDTKTVKGRYVRVELPGKQRTLTLAEVEVLSDGKNVALRKKATQSSTAHGGLAARGVDGNKNGSYGDGGQTHTQEGTNDPWWEVDLGAEYPIEKVIVYNRTDGALGSRLNNFTLRVLDAGKRTVYQSVKNRAPKDKVQLAVGTASPERIVRHSAMRALTSVRGKEAEAFAAIAKFVSNADERQPAIQALLHIPAKEWPKDAAKPLLAEVMKFVRSLPVADRTTPAALDAMQFGESLAGLLPPAEAKAARKELGEIGVRVIRVGTLTDQMLFDKDRLTVQAGKPVEFVFENTDLMPHNFVIVAPGALERVGNIAEVQGTQPGAAERNYVPSLEEPGTILLASRLLQPQQTQQLRFAAPKQPGIYPYVCTYPGHWRRMYGALYVVADLDEYLANPEAYLAKNPLPVKDDLLKFNRPRTEWKLEELAAAVQDMDEHGGRSFANGKQMFTVATCVACHKFGGQGNEFGPDLTKLDPKTFTSTTDVLKHVLDPSLKIDDKYALYSLTLSSGKGLTGMIVEEKNGVVKVIENPLASAKPLELKAEDIEARKRATTSPMPKGLLDKLTKDEILDLLAYVRGGADPKHRLFQGGHDHHKH